MGEGRRAVAFLICALAAAAGCKSDVSGGSGPPPAAALKQDAAAVAADSEPVDPALKLAAKLAGECGEKQLESCRALGVLHADGIEALLADGLVPPSDFFECRVLVMLSF